MEGFCFTIAKRRKSFALYEVTSSDGRTYDRLAKAIAREQKQIQAACAPAQSGAQVELNKSGAKDFEQ
jgi:hypothetical protein